MRSTSASRNKQQSECRDQICSSHTQRRKTGCSERWKTRLCKGRKLSRAVGKKKTWLMFSCVSHPAPALFYLSRRKEQKSAKVCFNKQTRFPIHISQPVRPMPAAISCSGSQITLLVDLKWPLKGPVVVVCCRFTISCSPLISGSLFFPKIQTYCRINTQGPIDTWESFPHTKSTHSTWPSTLGTCLYLSLGRACYLPILGGPDSWRVKWFRSWISAPAVSLTAVARTTLILHDSFEDWISQHHSNELFCC